MKLNTTLSNRVAEASDSAMFSAILADTLTRWGDRPAFDHPGVGVYSYADTSDMLSRMMRVFVAHGVGRGQGIGVLSTNCSEAWMAGAAVQCGGGYYCALPWRSSLEDLVYIADDADLSAIVVHPDFAERASDISDRCGTPKTIFTLGPSVIGIDLLEQARALAPGPLQLPADLNGDDVALLWYTGGTTGFPKGAIHTQSSLCDVALRFLIGYELPREIRYLAAGPISHSGWPLIAPTLINGGCVVLMDVFDADRFIDLANEKKATVSIGVPTMIYALIDAVRIRNVSIPSLERFIYGGSPILPARLVEAHALIGTVFTQSYGQSEVLGAGTALLASEHDVERPDRLASCGRPVPGVQMALLDDDGKPVAQGEVGEICMRTRSAMRGYWKQPELTAQIMSGGWIHSGDLARMDADGYYTIVDRKKDMIVSGGFNVYPAEVERVLSEHPDVRLVAVIGVPDDKWGEAVKAIIVPTPGRTLDPDALIAAVRDRKGGVNTPKTIDIVSELPMTAMGKIDKKALRSKYWSGASRNVN